MKRKIILASGSPRRKELLKSVGLTFRVVSSRIDEKLNPRLKPQRQAEELSLQKAVAVSKKYDDAVIIAADTIVVIDDEILLKPVDFREAKRFLRKLAGRKHQVITGFTIIDTNSRKRITKSAVTDVYMKHLTKREIDSYILREETSDKAGGYGIQGLGAVLFEKIEGDYFNIVGLPLYSLSEELKKFEIFLL